MKKFPIHFYQYSSYNTIRCDRNTEEGGVLDFCRKEHKILKSEYSIDNENIYLQLLNKNIICNF